MNDYVDAYLQYLLPAMMMIRYTIKNDWPTALNNEILPVLCKNLYYIISYILYSFMKMPNRFKKLF